MKQGVCSINTYLKLIYGTKRDQIYQHKLPPPPNLKPATVVTMFIHVYLFSIYCNDSPHELHCSRVSVGIHVAVVCMLCRQNINACNIHTW